jgi:hypothetical protein
MTHEESRNGKSQQSGSARKEKMAGSALLAAISILSASLGVTAAQSAVEVTAAKGSSTHDFNTRLAEEFKPKLQNNQTKYDPVRQKPVSKGILMEKRPFSINPPSPQVKPKR